MYPHLRGHGGKDEIVTGAATQNLDLAPSLALVKIWGALRGTHSKSEHRPFPRSSQDLGRKLT